jgi:hypothetical protein
MEERRGSKLDQAFKVDAKGFNGGKHSQLKAYQI